jgi:hypothetical protein
MQVGDLVWSLTPKHHFSPVQRRLAIIREVEEWIDEPRYHITLLACGSEGHTYKKFLEPVEVICK